MTAFVFIFVYYLGKPIFINFGISDRNRFFVALTIGLILETVVFAITGTSGYMLIAPMWVQGIVAHLQDAIFFVLVSGIESSVLHII